ncbi:MAG: asparagine--tRNA ligase, partial [Bacteroidetes bacterium]|nr:asparagine--tRNA ligase [Bacteroidota bacterium]
MNLKERVDLARLAEHDGQSISVAGWVAQSRSSKGLHFIVLRDGTARCQCVVAEASVSEASWAVATALTQEASVWIKGTVHRDDRQEGGYEVQVESISLIGASVDYPITPKDHGIDFLMNHRHVWLRSRRPWAIMKIRNQIISSIHAFFQEEDFVQMDAPILTGSSVEGTSTLFELDYFGSSAYLTQSGQLYGEAMALALGKIYTFGPTFRAEKSKTRRHLTEFWMIEPEMAFYDLDMNMDLAEAFLIRIVGDVLATCKEELQVLGRDLEPLQQVKGPFPRLTYTEAVELLRSDKTQEMFESREASLLQEQADLEAERSDNQRRYGQA